MKKSTVKSMAVLFWLAVWQVTANMVGQDLILPSPASILRQMCRLLVQPDFWNAALYSFVHIVTGFSVALAIGTALAVLSYRSGIIKILLSPLIAGIKSVTVASLVILFLVWFSAERLSVTVSVFMVFPVIYTSVLKGLEEVDSGLLEMARVFRVPAVKKVIYIYTSQVLPYFESAGVSALGLAWKSGIAAEVIGLPKNSIGENLYESKIYLNTVNLFAWTVAIIILGFISEKIFMHIIRHAVKKIEG